MVDRKEFCRCTFMQYLDGNPKVDDKNGHKRAKSGKGIESSRRTQFFVEMKTAFSKKAFKTWQR